MYEFRGHNFPAFIILMTGASEEHYLPCLEEIKKLVPSFNLKRAKGDMERAARNAILQAFAFLLAFLVSYCVFHYAQSLLRNIGYKGLLKQVSNKLHDCWKPRQTCVYLVLNDSLLINVNAKRNY